MNRVTRKIYSELHRGLGRIAYVIEGIRGRGVSRESIEDLKAAIRALPPREKASSAAQDEWNSNLVKLRQYVQSKDVRDFLNWDVIQQTMFHHPADTEYDYLQKSQFPKSLLIEDRIGNPTPYYRDTSTSGNLVHTAYNLEMLVQRLPHRDLNAFDMIIEFGGGYGSMCRLTRKYGFKNKYVIFDLPDFNCIQKFFLSSALPAARIAQVPDQLQDSPTLLTSELQTVSQARQRATGKVLVLATWSLSECPEQLREEFLKATNPDAFFIAFQKNFGEVDNMRFFENLKARHQALRWETAPIEQLPGNAYLFGLDHLSS
ncbi:MAG: putative sugar O-methyltransferase [Bdellovibrionaceae bacterium]|nr:putative sugar O-methyltransferase [Pseudobdellovibrionaceae bacterium]